MNVSPENHEILNTFIDESLEMLQRAEPLVRALVRQPDREDILTGVIGGCFRLFHSIKGTAGFLHLDHIAGPADAMEYLLDQVRSGILSLNPSLIALLAETCGFFAQGLPLVLREKNDERLAVPASGLVEGIMEAIYREQSQLRQGGGSGGTVPPEMREAFLWETDQLLEAAEQEFVLWDFISVDPQRVAELVRLLIRLKRNFALFDLVDLERLSQSLESVLDRYLQGEFFQTEYPERVFLRSIDAMRLILSSIIRTGEVEFSGLEPHFAALQGLMRQPIGILLVEAGLVAPQTVEEALERQKSEPAGKPRRLGEVLVEMGKVTPGQVQDILQEQHRKKTLAQEAGRALDASSPAPSPSWRSQCLFLERWPLMAGNLQES